MSFLVSGINSQLDLDSRSYQATVVELECTHHCVSPMRYCCPAAVAARPQAEALVLDLSCSVQAREEPPAAA